jgi:hypothetical protein
MESARPGRARRAWTDCPAWLGRCMSLALIPPTPTFAGRPSGRMGLASQREPTAPDSEADRRLGALGLWKAALRRAPALPVRRHSLSTTQDSPAFLDGVPRWRFSGCRLWRSLLSLRHGGTPSRSAIEARHQGAPSRRAIGHSGPHRTLRARQDLPYPVSRAIRLGQLDDPLPNWGTQGPTGPDGKITGEAPGPRY